MSTNPNLIVNKSLASTALGQFIQVLLTKALTEMGKNIDEIIKKYIEEIGSDEWSVDLSKVDFKNLATKVKKEIVKTFEGMDVEFKKPEINESQR